MAAAVEGVVTYVAREKWSKVDVDQDTHPKFKYFKIGTGGWEEVGGERVSRTPDPSLTDLDVIENPTRYPADERYSWNSWVDNVAPYPQRFEAADLSFQTPRTAVARCLVHFEEANDRGDGEAPEFWEIGVFDEDDEMVVYATFPKETKTEDHELEKEVRLTR